MRTAQFAPTLPAPTTVTFFRKTASFTFRGFPTDYNVEPVRARPNPVTIKSVADSSSSIKTTKALLHSMLGRTGFLLIAGLLAMLVLFLALAWATRDALAELPFLQKQLAEASRPAPERE